LDQTPTTFNLRQFATEAHQDMIALRQFDTNSSDFQLRKESTFYSPSPEVINTVLHE